MPFHGGNTGSIPVGRASEIKYLAWISAMPIGRDQRWTKDRLVDRLAERVGSPTAFSPVRVAARGRTSLESRAGVPEVYGKGRFSETGGERLSVSRHAKSPEHPVAEARIMKVFISWSGKRSNLVAKALRVLLEDVNHRIAPWMSELDIKAGSRWGSELATQLERTRFGIICLTPEALTSPWLLFEAGALSKSVQDGRVCPYLIDLKKDNLVGPLAQFQCVEATMVSTFNLLIDINSASGDEAIPEGRLRRYFEQFWPSLEHVITEVISEKGGLASGAWWEDYEHALREFRLIDQTLADMNNLKSAQVNEYYKQIGVFAVFQDVFGIENSRELDFVYSVGRFAPPVWGAGVLGRSKHTANILS